MFSRALLRYQANKLYSTGIHIVHNNLTIKYFCTFPSVFKDSNFNCGANGALATGSTSPTHYYTAQ